MKKRVEEDSSILYNNKWIENVKDEIWKAKN